MKGGLREEVERVIELATEDGMMQTCEFWRMTPREIEREVCAFVRARRRQAEELDTAAWMTGRYCAIGILTPGKYPRRPLFSLGQKMTEDEMKRVFLKLARREEGENGIGTGYAGDPV